MHSKEIWKDVVGEEGKYQVSNLGNIFSSISNRLLTLSVRNDKYIQVSICNKTKQVHRLVALAFLPNPENKPQINHIDGNPGNNNVNNLAWVTCAENQRHKFDVLGYEHSEETKQKIKDSQNNKPVEQVDIETGEIIATYPSMTEASKQTGVNNGSISYVCSGKGSTAGNYIWRYKNN